MPDTIIHSTTMVTMDDDNNNKNVIHGSIEITGGRITRISEESYNNNHKKNNNTDKNTKIIDGSNLVLIPGLINTHGHAAMCLLRGFADDLPLMDWLQEKMLPSEDRMNGDAVYWGTMLAVTEMIKSGTTTFTDMYFFMDRVAEAVEETGIRAVLSRGVVSLGGKFEKTMQETGKLIENWHGAAGGRISIMAGPHAPYTCPPEFLKEVITLAGKENLPVQIHLCETRQEVESCRKEHGLTPVELVNETGLFDGNRVICAHCVHLTEKDIHILAEKKVSVSHNPASNLKLGSGIAPLEEMLKAGIRVGLGTDGAASNNNLDMFKEMRLASLLSKGVKEDPTLVPARRAIQLATCMGAEALFLPDIGKIREGYRADITGIRINRPHLCPLHDVESHIVYSASGPDVELVMVEGALLMENGNLLTIDEEKVMHEAGKHALRITGKN